MATWHFPVDERYPLTPAHGGLVVQCKPDEARLHCTLLVVRDTSVLALLAMTALLPVQTHNMPDTSQCSLAAGRPHLIAAQLLFLKVRACTLARASSPCCISLRTPSMVLQCSHRPFRAAPLLVALCSCTVSRNVENNKRTLAIRTLPALFDAINHVFRPTTGAKRYDLRLPQGCKAMHATRRA